MDQSRAIMLRQLCYGKVSFIVLIPGERVVIPSRNDPEYFGLTWSILISKVSSESAAGSKQWLAKTRALTAWACLEQVVLLFLRSQFRLGPWNRCDKISQAEVTTGPMMGKLVWDDSMIWELAKELFSCWSCWNCDELCGTTNEQADWEVGLTNDTAEHWK